MAEAIVLSLSTQSTEAASTVVPIDLLADDAAELFDSSSNARALIEQLIANERAMDALKCVTWLLPKQYVLVWGLSTLRRCATEASGGITDTDRAAIAVVERWLSDSSEESRLAAQQFAEDDDYATPGGWISAAAAWMAGSLGPADCETVEPPSTLPGEAVAAAIIALAARDPEHLEASLARWVGEALEAFGGEGVKP